MTRMTDEELQEFLRRPLIVSFTTVRPGGAPHTTPIWYEYDDGKFYCFASSEAVKTRNVVRDPQVSLCIATHDEPYRYVLAEGTCAVVSDGVDQRAHSISARYYGEERGKQFARDILASGSTVLLVVTPTKLRNERVD
jgi:PPOX class probable F420-dependent enzyme